MRVRAGLLGLVLLALATAPVAAQQHETSHGKNGGQPAAFERFKQLAGDWAGTEQGKDDREIRVSYKVTAGGSAVVETIFPGTAHEMVTVIHPDREDLLLTHYCMLGNQPQMRASGKGDGKTVAFQFVRATNLKSDNDAHMHSATFTFEDKDTLRSEWTHYRGGKSAGRVVFLLKRQK